MNMSVRALRAVGCDSVVEIWMNMFEIFSFPCDIYSLEGVRFGVKRVNKKQRAPPTG